LAQQEKNPEKTLGRQEKKPSSQVQMKKLGAATLTMMISVYSFSLLVYSLLCKPVPMSYIVKKYENKGVNSILL